MLHAITIFIPFYKKSYLAMSILVWSKVGTTCNYERGGGVMKIVNDLLELILKWKTVRGTAEED